MSQSSYKARLASLRARRQAGAGASLPSDFSTPLCGGLGRLGTIQPVLYGEELALIQDAETLCLGRIGAGGNVCLKRAMSCDTEAHSKKKGTLPYGRSLILLRGEEKGYENVTLDANDLDKSFIDELLTRTNKQTQRFNLELLF